MSKKLDDLVIEQKGMFEAPDMQIHSLYILKETGVCLYSRKFTERLVNIDEDLISALISALVSFSKDITAKRLEVIEMMDLKIAIKMKENFMFVLISDSLVSPIFLFDCLEGIAIRFLNFYSTLGPSREHQVIMNRKVDLVFDFIVKGLLTPFVFTKFQNMKEYIDNLIVNNEIIGAAVLSITGRVYYSSLPKKILMSSIKEFETISKDVLVDVYSIFEKEKSITIKKKKKIIDRGFPEAHISLSKNGQKIFTKQISYKTYFLIIIIQFESNVSLGIAEMTFNKIIKELRNIR